MLLSLIAAAPLLASTAGAPPAQPVLDDHGKLPWIEGTFDELLARAQKEDRLIFIDFWTDWCGWCKRLDADTFSDDAVVEEMKDILCFSVDAESETGEPLARRYNVRGFPALILLNPDGSPRDQIGGYLPPDEFRKEIQRVRKDEGTLNALRRAVERTPGDLQARYDYAVKLREMGDEEGYEGQIATIHELDPEDLSPVSRRLKLAELKMAIEQQAKAGEQLDLAPIEAFLADEKEPELRFDGWAFVAAAYNFMVRTTSEPVRARGLLAKSREANRRAWKSCPEMHIGEFGNSLAYGLFEQRDEISSEDKLFALEVARKATEALGDDPNMLDTLACCLFMNGKAEEAIATIQRAIELDPENADWKERLVQFQEGL